jgi:hypothetical protein
MVSVGRSRYAARLRVPAFFPAGAFFAVGFLDRAFLADSAWARFCFAAPRRRPPPVSAPLTMSEYSTSSVVRSLTRWYLMRSAVPFSN